MVDPIQIVKTALCMVGVRLRKVDIDKEQEAVIVETEQAGKTNIKKITFDELQTMFDGLSESNLRPIAALSEQSERAPG